MITLGLLPTNLAFGGLLVLPLGTRLLLGMARLQWWSRCSASWTSEMAKCSRMCTQWSWMARHCLSKMVRQAGVGYARERWRSDTTAATIVTLSSCVSDCRHIRLGLLQHVSDVLPRARQGHAGDATSAGPWRQSVRANALACRCGWNVLILCGLAVGRSNVQVHLKLGQIGT